MNVGHCALRYPFQNGGPCAVVKSEGLRTCSLTPSGLLGDKPGVPADSRFCFPFGGDLASEPGLMLPSQCSVDLIQSQCGGTVLPVTRELRQEDYKLKASLGY